jgi:hypothetical protein
MPVHTGAALSFSPEFRDAHALNHTGPPSAEDSGTEIAAVFKQTENRDAVYRFHCRPEERETMRTRQSLMGGLLIVAFLPFCGGANSAPQATSPKKNATTSPTAELIGEIRAPLLLDAGPAAAQKQSPARNDAPRERAELIPIRRGEMRVGLDVLVDGKPLPTIQYAGKTYLPVPRPGAEYELRVWNHGPARVVAVVSVDGLSVINGLPASESHPGYIVAPYSHILIKGWRRNMDMVAAFRFVEREKSYASLVGKPENIGVIGLVAIEELVWRPRPLLEKETFAAPSARRAGGEVGSIGTEYGREVDSRVYYVPFVRSTNKRTITLCYDTVEALRPAGVPVDHPLPVPFPVDQQFVPPPPGYKGR